MDEIDDITEIIDVIEKLSQDITLVEEESYFETEKEDYNEED